MRLRFCRKANFKEICEDMSFPSFSEKCWRQQFFFEIQGYLGKTPAYPQFSLWIPITLAKKI